MKNIEQPVTTPDEKWPGGTATKTTHPAFALISAHRVSGDAYLYGSDFRHHNTIRINISSSEHMRDLSHDWHFGRKELIEVELSEAQWATFISTLNVGPGTPATLVRAYGQDVPGLPPPPGRKEQFIDEMTDRLKDVSAGLADLREQVKNLKISQKQKDDLLRKIEVAGYGIGSNLKYGAEQFGKHVEHTIEQAKTEVEAYVSSVVHRAGIAALRNEAPPITLPSPNEGDECGGL